jgi:hypothetical protein
VHVQVVLTRAAAVAERLWSERRSSTDVARQRLAAFRCRLLRRGLQAAPVFPDACDAPVAPHPAHPFGETAPPPNVTASQSRVPSLPPDSTVVPSPDAVPPPPPPHLPHVPHAAISDSRAQGALLLESSRASGLAGAAPLAPPALIGAALLASLALNLLLCTCLWRRRQRPPRATDPAERLKSD